MIEDNDGSNGNEDDSDDGGNGGDEEVDGDDEETLSHAELSLKTVIYGIFDEELLLLPQSVKSYFAELGYFEDRFKGKKENMEVCMSI